MNNTKFNETLRAIVARAPETATDSPYVMGERLLLDSMLCDEELRALLEKYGYASMDEAARKKLYGYFYDISPQKEPGFHKLKGLYRTTFSVEVPMLGFGKQTSEKQTEKVVEKQTEKAPEKAPVREERKTTYLDFENTCKKLEEFFSEQQEMDTFGKYVTEFIRTRGMDHVEVYKRAHFSRQDFSRIVNSSTISRSNVFNLAIGLMLDEKETESLFRHAGYALRGDKFDSIVLYFIREKHYDIGEINLYLYEYGQRLLTDNLDTGSGDRGIK